jgi:hypothetical protein
MLIINTCTKRVYKLEMKVFYKGQDIKMEFMDERSRIRNIRRASYRPVGSSGNRDQPVIRS